VTAPIQLTHAVIADFIAKNQGHIVFVGSIFGSLGFPYFATYCASKFAIHGFSQSLRRELLDRNIGITYIAPRGIKTAMNDARTVAMSEKTGSQMDDPQTVAKRIIQALEKEQQEVFIGQPQSFFAWLNGVCPALVNFGLKKTTLIARQFL
jgi:short-subunit dehydrogenase